MLDKTELWKNQLSERIIALEKKLTTYPDGKLRICKNGDTVKWYHSLPGKPLVVIPKKKREFAQQLAEKHSLLAELQQLKYEYQVFQSVCNQTPIQMSTIDKKLMAKPEFQELLKNFNPSVEEWRKQPYQKLDSHPENLVLKTCSGNVVRSKSELLIDEALFREGIPFRYEAQLMLRTQPIYPDFSILHPKTQQLYYWEHFGMVDNERYAAGMCQKIRQYCEANIYPGDKLIMTFETKAKPLTTLEIEEIIRQKFL